MRIFNSLKTSMCVRVIMTNGKRDETIIQPGVSEFPDTLMSLDPDFLPSYSQWLFGLEQEGFRTYSLENLSKVKKIDVEKSVILDSPKSPDKSSQSSDPIVAVEDMKSSKGKK